MYRLSQSPSLVLSGSRSWPQGERTFIPCSAPNLQEEFSSCRFYPITNGFTDAPSIKPDHATWNVTWTVLIQIQFCGLYFNFVLSLVFKYKALVGILSSSIWVLYQDRIFLAAMEWENITDLFCFECAYYKAFIFMFSFMAFANLAMVLTYLNSTNEGPDPKCLETELTNITRRHFCSLPVFCIKHSFIYFIYFLLSEFFSVVCLFWHTLTARDDTHATTHVTGTQIIHAKMASLNAIFCRGNKSSSRPLTHFCSRKQKIYRLRFVLIKKFELNL